MRLKLSLQRAGERPTVDLVVTADPGVVVADLARALLERDPLGPSAVPADVTLSIAEGTNLRPLRGRASVAEAGLRSGQSVVVTTSGGVYTDVDPMSDAAAVLHVVQGADAGKRFPLRAGANEVGRGPDNDVVLSDALASKRHLRVNVTEHVEVLDLGSSNGVVIGGVPILERTVVTPEDDILVGDTVLRVVPQRGRVVTGEGSAAEPFVRSPQLEPQWAGPTLQAPQPPERPQAGRMSFIPLLMPMVFGGVMFAVTRQLVTVLFVALSPLMMVGNLLEQRFGAKRAYKEAVEHFQKGCAELRSTLTGLSDEERRGRCAEHPATAAVLDASTGRGGLLWSRRPDRPRWLELRLGLGSQPSRTVVELPSSKQGEPELWAALREIASSAAVVGPVPVVADLGATSLGIAGPRPSALAAARAVVAQLVGLHSPSELVLCGLSSVSSSGDWDWMKWLPHTASEHSPLTGEHLAAGAGQGAVLLTALEEVLELRSAEDEKRKGLALPVIVLLVEDDNGCDRSRVVEVAERGRAAGIHVIWVANDVSSLPAACSVFLSTGSSDGRAVVGRTVDGSSTDVVAESATAQDVQDLGKLMAPLVDAGARVDDATDLPRAVSALQVLGHEVAAAPEAVLDVWRTSGSLPGQLESSGRAGLRASVGKSGGNNLVLDLREQGPHALVGGTTGAGKSEFLQSWVMGMAMEHSPARVTFLFVDYKGGAAFSECTRLPHCVGLVTDLSPHLVRRALTSLDAELKHREHVLQSKKAKDLFELERRGDAEAPPSLVIVVDEFAALVQEVPEFVDGVVNVAQRGRSLGLNLILATQRPAGVIKDNLRANTNLRIALRMADEADSDDVVGSKVAAGFSPSIPGRAVAKTGPGRLVPFQSSYVGGWTPTEAPPPAVEIAELGFGATVVWEAPKAASDSGPVGPNDLTRMVDNVRQAYAQTGAAPPRRPWLDPLADVYDIMRSPQSRTDTELVFGIVDDPEHQVQRHIAFQPDVDGNMAVFGTGGSGKSTFLRTIALAAGAATRGGPCHVYGLDFGSRGLSMLEGLPHVGAIINGDDDERVARLLQQLRSIVESRADRFAAVRAGSLSDYRQLADLPDEPRIVLLVDNVGTFRQGYEVGERGKLFDTFVSLAADGRQVGVHVVVSADRTGAVPTALASLMQRRLVLRLAGDADYAMLGVDDDVLETAPPGRGVMDGREVQVLIMGTSPSVADQASLVSAYGRSIAELAAKNGKTIEPMTIGRLPDVLTLGELPVVDNGHPVVGVADDSLGPAAILAEDVLVLAGPPQSGRSTVLLTLALAVSRVSGGKRVHLGAGRSAVAAGTSWDLTAAGPADVAEAARTLATELASWHQAGKPLLVVIESLPDFLQTEADMPLQDLIKACRAAGAFVVVEGETSQMLSSWPLLQAARSGRTGILLQPEQVEGENLFKTSLPRMARGQFPPGRGIYVRAGRARRIQFALPDLATGE